MRAAELFQGIPEEEARRIAGLFAERSYPRGATIFSLGDPADSVYIMKEGLVEIISVSDKGTKTILHLLQPDGVFGELLFSEDRRLFTAVAATETVVTVIGQRCFQELLGSFPTVAMNFIRVLSARLAKVQQGVAEFGHSWSYYRLARVFLQLGEEYGVESSNGTRIPLRLTHENIANLIGTSRETATTQINRFKRMGLIRREGGNFVLDRRRLARFFQSC